MNTAMSESIGKTTSWGKVIDIAQWVLIVLLCAACAILFFNTKKYKAAAIAEVKTENTYQRIYDSQTLETLQKRNKELADSIRSIRNAETAVSIQYVHKYHTDTIHVREFVQPTDSTYHYSASNDTIDTEIEIGAKDLSWVKVQASLRGNFTIINGEKDNENYLYIAHPDDVEITDVDAWHRKESKTWRDVVKFGPQVGVGYGIATGKFDAWVGLGVTVAL